MSRVTRTAFVAVSLLATTSLSGVAFGQAAYSNGGTNFVPVNSAVPVVSFTQGGNSYQNVGHSNQGYSKGARPVLQYAPVEYVPAEPEFYDSAVVPVVEFDDGFSDEDDFDEDIFFDDEDAGFDDAGFEDDMDFEDDFGFEDDDFSSSDDDFIDPEIDDLIDELADEDLDFEDDLTARVNNFVRLSGGYGFATMGTFGYGAEYDAYDAVEQDQYSSETPMRGPAGAFRADVASFFIDGGFGYFTHTGSVEVDDDIEDLGGLTDDPLGPQFTLVDGTQTDSSGLLTALTQTTDVYLEGDILKTTYERTSTLTSFGGAAGYTINFGGGLGIGVGIGGRRIQGTDTVAVTQDAQDESGTSYDAADFTYADHNLELSYTGNYVGPVIRLNFEQELGNRITAHFGGSAQALYGQRTLDARQTDTSGTTISEMTQVAVNGFAFGGEVDAGLGFAVTDNLSLSVGGFGSFLSAAPGFSPHDADLVTDGTGDFATMRDQALITYGLKGALTLGF